LVRTGSRTMPRQRTVHILLIVTIVPVSSLAPIPLAVGAFHALQLAAGTLFHVGAAHTAAGAAGAAVGAAGAAGAAPVLAGVGVGMAKAKGAAAAITALSTPSTGIAATQASLAGIAATGGVTAAKKLTPEAITSTMRSPSQGAKSQAIGRILSVEWKRLKKTAEEGSPEPIEVVRRVTEKAQDRAPIITWALDLWVRSRLQLGADAKGDFVPGIWTSLRVLEIELATQIKFGLTTAPGRVLKLVGSAIVVTVVALMAQLRLPAVFPDWFRRQLQQKWPGLVDHLAATLERNLEECPKRATKTHGYYDPAPRGALRKGWGAAWRRWFPIANEQQVPTPAPLTLGGVHFKEVVVGSARERAQSLEPSPRVRALIEAQAAAVRQRLKYARGYRHPLPARA